MSEDGWKTGIRFSEEFIKALASRYGFRPRDYSLTWDGAEFQTSRNVHELTITSSDGRSFTTQIDDATLARQDAWKYLRDIDAGFRSLSRRHRSRGL